jgi:hypothetical protein
MRTAALNVIGIGKGRATRGFGNYIHTIVCE